MESKRILYLSYWGIGDVLTASSVFPSLRALSSLENVSEIVFCSIERDNKPLAAGIYLPAKVKHVPLKSSRGISLLKKVYDFTVFPRIAANLIKKHNINTIICRSSLAGGMLLKVARKRSIPIIIESFEPHSEYMVDSGVWSRTDVRTRLSHLMEKRLKSEADFLFPVSENYRLALINDGVDPSKIRVMPCVVQTQQFDLNLSVREKLRSELGWTDLVVGIYIGKFGGIYYDVEAFEQFREAFRFFEDRFALIILSAQEGVAELVERHLSKSVGASRVRVLSVPHDKVASYLACADFAFSTIKPAPSRKFCSPIKHGEYWASGLPIVVEEGIGDDSAIIAHEGGGVILRRPAYGDAFQKIDTMLKKKGRMEIYKHIRGLALKYRDEKTVYETYRDILK